MKKNIVRAISVLLFVVLLLACLSKVSGILERKDSQYKYKDFYKQKEDFDVLFMGTSHVINGVFPMEMWDNYGIVSYNFGGHGNQMATSYWVMMNALQYTTPKLVVIDVLEVGRDFKVSENEDQSRLSIDSMPFSKVKVEAIKDLFGDKELIGTEREDLYEKRWEFLFDFGKYHSRWNDLQREDLDPTYSSPEKGAETRVRVDEPMEYYIVPREIKLEDHTVGAQYLRKMIEECQSRGIEVLLTHVPYPAVEWHQEGGNLAYDIAEEYGVDYINFVAMDNVVNYNTDCYDSHGHLNASGAKRVSEYLGKYIVDRYGIPDRRTDDAYAGWHQDYQEYYDMKENLLHNEEDVYNALMLLQDDDFDAIIYVNDGSAVSKNPKIYQLILSFLGEQGELSESELSEGEYSDIFAVRSHDDELSEIAVGRTHSNIPLVEVYTAFGKVTYRNSVGGERSIRINEEDENLLDGYVDRYDDDEPHEEPVVSVWVYNNKTHERIFRLFWNGSDNVSIVEKLN